MELKQQLSQAHAQSEERDAQLIECKSTAADREARARANAGMMEQRYQTQLDEMRKQLGDRNIDLMTIHRHLGVDLDAGVAATPTTTIESYLRGRRLGGLVERMVLCFGTVHSGQTPPPLDDDDAPPLPI